MVLEVVNEMFRYIKESSDEAVLKKNFNKEMRSYKAKKTKLNLDLTKNKKQLDKPKDEAAASLTGESRFSPKLLGKIGKIDVYKGYDINIELNPDYKQFCEDWDTVNTESSIN